MLYSYLIKELFGAMLFTVLRLGTVKDIYLLMSAKLLVSSAKLCLKNAADGKLCYIVCILCI